ncbi:MAG: hypothetical protein M0Z33_03550 [Actinomycetota bacterium]|nr:hypothetical protein [Actinomycetota bacterium]
MKKNAKVSAVAVLAGALAGTGTLGATAASASPRDAHAARPTATASSLAGICPSTVKIQMNWTPEAEQGAYYELASSSGTINASQKYYTAPLIDPATGAKTGVKVEVLAGGPAVGYTSPERLLYTDSSILLGMDATDSQIEAFSTSPTVGVVSPMYTYDNVFFWNPAKYHFTAIKDFAASNATLLSFGAKTPLNSFLEAKKWITPGQVDGAYNGTPAQFVATGGGVISGGYATYEPYFYAHQLSAWDKPISYELIANTGYNPYSEDTFTTPQNVTRYASCFKKLVPMIQQAQINFEQSPNRVNQLIVKLDDAYKIGGGYNMAVGTYAAQTLLKDRIIANPPRGGFGSFTMKRVNTLIHLLEHTHSLTGLPANFSASKIETNKFIDPTLEIAYHGPYNNVGGVITER